jgi:Arc/MetJ-type ribon-helix-helix transcriptional regulator
MSRRVKRRWNIPVPAVLDEAVEKAVELGMHATKSDLIREAVREKLERMGLRIQPFRVERK